jgi:hypothetical protein
MSLLSELLEAFINSLPDKEKNKVEDELKSASVEEIAEDISEIVVDTTGGENDTESEDVDEADAEAGAGIDDGDTDIVDADTEAGADADTEAGAEDAESDAEAEPEVEGEDNVDADDSGEAEAEDDSANDSEDDSAVDAESDSEGENLEAEEEAEGENPEAEGESTDGKRIADIEAKLDMIIQMLTTSGPDGTHVPFVNIPGRSHYHDDMDLGEATRVLLTGKF